MIGKTSIEAKYSKLSENILKILKKEQYIKDYQLQEKNKKKLFLVELKYEGVSPALRQVKIVSKSGGRIYSKKSEIKQILGGLGMSIISTPKGVMTGKEARKESVGGEMLFQIW